MSGNIEQGLIDTIERRLDTLRSVADVARNALDETADYKDRGAVPDAYAKVDAALERIRRELACELAVTEQDIAEPVPGTDTPKRDWLEMPGGFKLIRFRVAGRATFVGARKNHGDNGGNIYVVETSREPGCADGSYVKIERNGELLASGFFYCARESAVENAAVGMLHGYLARIDHDRLHNKRNKKNRQARKAATNAAAEIANGEGTK